MTPCTDPYPNVGDVWWCLVMFGDVFMVVSSFKHHNHFIVWCLMSVWVLSPNKQANCNRILQMSRRFFMWNAVLAHIKIDDRTWILQVIFIDEKNPSFQSFDASFLVILVSSFPASSEMISKIPALGHWPDISNSQVDLTHLRMKHQSWSDKKLRLPIWCIYVSSGYLKYS